MTVPVVAVTDLQVAHRGGLVLDLERLVVPGGTTALLGRNGAGKSTLLRVLATVARPDRGSVLVDGHDVTTEPTRTEVRRRLGYASQHDRLPDRMRVAEFCDYVAALKEIGPRRIRLRWSQWVLAETGLDDVAQARIATLSGGMRRRLLVAQALIGSPTLLILDEPLVSLDADQRSRLVRSIAASADDRTTIVATHHADELGAVCRHVVVLDQGRLCFAGPPDQLAARADGRVWESSTPIAHPSARALAHDRYRVVDVEPPSATQVPPTVHDGYLAVLNDATPVVAG